MKTMARRRLSGLARLSLTFIVALTLAMPYYGTNAYANEGLPNTSGNTDIFNLVAFSSDAKASNPSSLEEAKAALDSANQDKADAAANKDAAQSALDSATASYNQAASAHQNAVDAAEGAKAQAGQAVDAAVVATQQELKAAQDAYSAAEKDYEDAKSKENDAKEVLKEAEGAYNAAKAEFDQAIANSGDGNLQQAAAQLEQAKIAWENAQAHSKELADKRNDLENQKANALATWQELGPKVTAAQAAADNAAQAVTQAQSALDAARAELNNAPEDQTPAIQARIDAAQAKVAAAQSAKGEAEGRLAAAQNEQAAAQAALDEANRKLAELQGGAGGSSDLAALEQAVRDAQQAYDEAVSTYQSQAAGAGATQTYNEAQQARDNASTAYENAKQATQDAKANLDQAQAELDAITGGSTQNLSDDASNDSEPGTVSDGDDSTGDSTYPNSGGETTEPDSRSDGGSEGITTLDESDPDALANAQQKVNECQGIYDTAVQTEASAKATLDAAEEMLNKALSVKSYEDDMNAKAQQLANAQAAYQAALNGSGSEDPAVTAAKEAVAAAQVELSNKAAAVTSINAEIAGYESTIQNETANAEAAQRELDSYVAPDLSGLQQAVTDAENALVEAQDAKRAADEEVTKLGNQQTDAYNLYERLDTEYRAAVAEKQAYDGVVDGVEGEGYRAKQAYQEAQTNYNNAGGNRPEIVEYKRNMDTCYNKMNAQKTTVSVAERASEDAKQIWIDATTREDMATLKLERVTAAAALKDQQSIEAALDALLSLTDYEEFAAMNEHVERINAHQNTISELAVPRDAAKVELDQAQASFDAANNNYSAAEAAAAEAQRVYDEWLNKQNGTSTDDGSNNNQGGDTSTNRPSENKPATKPANTSSNKNTSSKASMKTADKKTADSADVKTADKATDGEDEEEVVEVAQPTTTTIAKKPATLFGIDPLIAGIVGGAIVIAAAAAIIAAVVRRRNKNNTAQ